MVSLCPELSHVLCQKKKGWKSLFLSGAVICPAKTRKLFAGENRHDSLCDHDQVGALPMDCTGTKTEPYRTVRNKRSTIPHLLEECLLRVIGTEETEVKAPAFAPQWAHSHGEGKKASNVLRAVKETCVDALTPPYALATHWSYQF